ncbi:trimeric intracellular cation channel family protein [Priestia taiwanensis]|uniref:Permease n=1 Tax=Priestia taiwanensis TaxID=1347902 RepID=A0A917ANJ9_9BACI|nr:trimeric intracellular cation channel family protein [Priestia taiwanensis]MBM7362496.1 putative membrane protein YeiH [Priestia taiwanensis]GGE62676.1 permease [Priestia taiwanensis]
MTLITIFVFIGIIAASISGALIGIKKQLDLFGVICLAVLTSLGGGIIRDLLIGRIPPIAFIEPSYFFTGLAAALFAWVFYHHTDQLRAVILISDAVGLGVFTAVGASAAIEIGMDKPFIVISMGLITGIGGGVLRDVCSKEIPFVFRKEIYAIAAIIGAASLYVTYDYVPQIISLYICLTVTFMIRIISVWYNLNFPVIKTKISPKHVKFRLHSKETTIIRKSNKI